jgi:hypothetical protein
MLGGETFHFIFLAMDGGVDVFTIAVVVAATTTR